MSRAQFKLFFRFLKLLLPYRGKWLAILALSGLGALLSLVIPYLSKLVIDEGIISKDLWAFTILVLIGVVVFILNGAIDSLRQFVDNYIGYKVNFDLNKKVFKHMQNLPLSYFTNKSRGERHYRINCDIGTVTSFVTTTLRKQQLFFLNFFDPDHCFLS